jgi:hypothetical protein
MNISAFGTWDQSGDVSKATGQSKETSIKPEKGTIRLLGAVFLLVFLASIISNALLDSATGAGSISEMLGSIPNHLTLMRVSILIELVTSLGIVALAALLFVMFGARYRIIATVALGWWLAEGITLGLSKLGAYTLIPLSQSFIEAGSPASSFYQELGDFFYYGLDRQAWSLHMLFFSLGGILWCYLFYKSKAIPRWLSIWGVAALCLVTINVIWSLYDPGVGVIIYLGLPYMVFEFLIGPWLMIAGIREDADLV